MSDVPVTEGAAQEYAQAVCAPEEAKVKASPGEGGSGVWRKQLECLLTSLKPYCPVRTLKQG